MVFLLNSFPTKNLLNRYGEIVLNETMACVGSVIWDGQCTTYFTHFPYTYIYTCRIY